ncbi:MAG: hypothetical protein P8M08_03350 [Akkermansiaceae bacterium]|nr:hypothetical protein [Akkermansiaceae bacterium]
MTSNSLFQKSLVLCLTGLTSASGFTLRVDFNASGVPQSGWESLSASDTALGDSWPKTIFASID